MAPKVIEKEWTDWTINFVDMSLTRATKRLRNVLFDEKRTLNFSICKCVP